MSASVQYREGFKFGGTVKVLSTIAIRLGALWFALLGFGSGVAMGATVTVDSVVAAAVVAGVVTLLGKVLDAWWKKREARNRAAQADTRYQLQSADRVAELTVEERRDLRTLMNDIYGRERALLELQIKTLQTQRSQDVMIIESLSRQLRIIHEQGQETDVRQSDAPI